MDSIIAARVNATFEHVLQNGGCGVVVTGDVTNAAGKTKRIVISVVEFEETTRDPSITAGDDTPDWKPNPIPILPRTTTEVIPVSMFDNDAEKQAAKLTGFNTVEARAEEFWQAYPRKIRKGQLQEAHELAIWNIVDKLKVADVSAHERIMTAVKAYAASPAGRDPKDGGADYRPAPSQWLIDQRWNDDPSQWQIPNGKKKAEDSKPKVEPLKKKGTP
jgi:hypothetical protein